MLSLTAFAEKLGKAIEKHLSDQEAAREAVSRLAAGAAFESWLSFEARLLLEGSRGEFELDGLCTDRHGCDVHRYFISNEYRYVDLGITTEEDWILSVEFKIIHNNKNWKSKCAEVQADMWPTMGMAKAQIEPTIGRLAAVLVIGKVYRDATSYPGQRQDLDVWEDSMWRHLLRPDARLERIWQSRRFYLRGQRLLSADAAMKHFCELHILGRTAPTS